MAFPNSGPKTFEYTEEMIGKLYKCSQDPIFFAQEFVYVVHPERGRIKICLRDYQDEFITAMHTNKKTICLASRQIGKTTAACCYILWYALFQPDKTVAVAANIDRTAKGILSDIKDMYNNLPDWMKLETVENNAHTLSFANGSKIFSFATSEAGISGESVSLLYMDEVAKITPATLAFEFWRNNIPTISHGEKIVVTSTPKGVGNLFHKLWKDAVDKRNGFIPIRIDWWQCPEYNSEEWKEEMIRDIGLVGFNSEYGNQFIGSQATVVSAEALKNLKVEDFIREEKIHGGYEKWWEDYKPNTCYCAAGDIGLGSGNDYTTLQIYKIKWRRPNIDDYKMYEKKGETVPEAIVEQIEQVFTFRSNLISIPQFVTYTFEVLQKWHDPYFIVENNGIGRSFIDKAREDHYYENAYIHEDSVDIGIDSNVKTKTMMVNALKDAADKGKIIVKDMDTINELMTYIEKKSTAGNRRFQAEEGSNDDLVVGLGWICFMTDTLWFQDVLTYVI